MSPGLFVNKSVMFADTVPPNLDEIIKVANKIQVIDHHKGNIKLLLDSMQSVNDSNKLQVLYNDDKCAAELMWDIKVTGRPYPWFLSVIGAHDCWRWKVCPPHYKALYRNIFSGKVASITLFDSLLNWTAEQMNDSVINGELQLIEDEKTIIQYIDERITTTYTDTGDYKYQVYVVQNCPWMYISEVGSRIALFDNCDFVVLSSYNSPIYNLSLRSAKGKTDISRIADDIKNKYGPILVIKAGGGINAGGAEITCDPFQLFEGTKPLQPSL